MGNEAKILIVDDEEIVRESLRDWLALEPEVCHISDTHLNSYYDEHCNFGHGEYDLEKIAKLLAGNTFRYLTIESSQ